MKLNVRISRVLGVMLTAILIDAALSTVAICRPKDQVQETGSSREGPQDQCTFNMRNSLQVLHSSDNESSFQDPNTLEVKVLNYATVAAGLRFIARAECIPTLHLTAGDHTLPGPFYRAAEEVATLGHAGLAIYNQMHLTANGMGNHELDGGLSDFAHMLHHADYPFITVNLDFNGVELAEGTPAIATGPEAASCALSRGKVVKSCWVTTGSQRIGLIGRAPADLFNLVNDPATSLSGLDFIGGRDSETNQPLVSAVDQVLEQVDKLEQLGVRKIILLDHAQDYTGDPLSAQKLRGIDIIIAAGSTGFMAKQHAHGPFNMLRTGDVAEAGYPTRRKDAEGQPVLVVNSDQQYRYVGNLIVTFDLMGHIVSIDERSGPVATTAKAITALGNTIGAKLSVPSGVAKTIQLLQDTALIQNAYTVMGTTDSILNGNRADVRSRATSLGRLAAESSLWYTRQVFPHLAIDVALKNGGGIRDSIRGPKITRLTIQAALAFDDRLAVLELTGRQLLAAMENSVSRVPALDGRFPQLAGMTVEYDARRPGLQAESELETPSRLKTLVITRAGGKRDVLVQNFVAQGNLDRTFTLATNDFLATGGDGYAALAGAARLAVTEIREQAILEKYILGYLNGVVSLSGAQHRSRSRNPPRTFRID